VSSRDVPPSSLFLINLLGDLLEICCKSDMSRSSSKIHDHAQKTSIPSANPPTAQREVIFSGILFPEFASGSSLPAAGS
jgi:hypothetical protein